MRASNGWLLAPVAPSSGKQLGVSVKEPLRTGDRRLSACESLSSELCMYGGNAAQSSFFDVFVRSMGDLEEVSAEPESRDAELGIPAGVEAAGAQLVAGRAACDTGDASAERLRRWVA